MLGRRKKGSEERKEEGGRREEGGVPDTKEGEYDGNVFPKRSVPKMEIHIMSSGKQLLKILSSWEKLKKLKQTF
jgi:hypothetical protein